MRNLIIHRQKSFVASLATMKVYIEDPVAGDLNINGCMCRKLGNIKNNETVTFQIDNTAARVYVIADKLSRGYSNEFYPLPAGTEDVVLSGKCHYNPGAGNPFRFDGVADESVIKNRKRSKRIGIAVMIGAVLVGVGIGILSNVLDKAKPMDISVRNMSMTITDDFEEMTVAGYDAGYESRNAAILVLQERFSLMAGLEDYTLQQYGKIVMQNNGKNLSMKTENDVLYFEYSATSEGQQFHYFVTLHKGPDAFWIIQFAVSDEDADEMREDIFQWAASVTFTE